jgi:uncharacterized protein
MKEDWEASFREKLDQHYAWPALYIFKFIVPQAREAQIEELFPLHTVTKRASSQGKYTSVTIQMMMPSSDAVIAIYKKASAIEGLIAL